MSLTSVAGQPPSGEELNTVSALAGSSETIASVCPDSRCHLHLRRCVHPDRRRHVRMYRRVHRLDQNACRAPAGAAGKRQGAIGSDRMSLQASSVASPESGTAGSGSGVGHASSKCSCLYWLTKIQPTNYDMVGLPLPVATAMACRPWWDLPFQGFAEASDLTLEFQRGSRS